MNKRYSLTTRIRWWFDDTKGWFAEMRERGLASMIEEARCDYGWIVTNKGYTNGTYDERTGITYTESWRWVPPFWLYFVVWFIPSYHRAFRERDLMGDWHGRNE